MSPDPTPQHDPAHITPATEAILTFLDEQDEERARATAPTPQHDHGAAGFCTDHARPAGTDPRIEAARAEAMRRWPGQGDVGWVRHGYVLGFTDAIAALDDAWDALAPAAVVAALDDESARLRGSADAWWTEYDRELKAHEATKAVVERLRAHVAAMPFPDEWEDELASIRAAAEAREAALREAIGDLHVVRGESSEDGGLVTVRVRDIAALAAAPSETEEDD